MKILKPRQIAAWVFTFTIMVSTNSAWSETISDMTLKTSLSIFIENALNEYSAMLAAKADIRSAKAVLEASDQAVFNPELELEYEETDVISQKIGIRQTIDWGDQKGSRTAVAEAGLNKAIADYDMTMHSSISHLLTALAQNQTSKELAQLSNETLSLMHEFKQVAERRYTAGDLNQVELNLARLAYNQALLEQANTLSNATQAREKLRAILGILPESLPSLPEQLPKPSLNDDLDAFLQQLPVIRSQLAEVQVVKKQVNLRKAEKAWNPTIGLSAGSDGEESLIGINLSIPLNVRNSYSADVDAAQQSLIAKEQRVHQAYRDNRSTLVTSTERYRLLLKTWNNWRQHSRSSVDQQLTLIKQLWQAGDISAADYLLQLKQALETQASGLELRNQLWQVAFDWMSMTAQIDNWLNIKTQPADKELTGTN